MRTRPCISRSLLAVASLPVLGSIATPQASAVAAEPAQASFTWGDFDGDALADALAVSPHAPARLFKNRGDGTLLDVTREAGLPTELRARFALFEDIERDGDRDLLLAEIGGSSRLFQNQGDATFVDTTVLSGTVHDGEGLHAAFFDFDRDGLSDLELGTSGGELLFHNLGAGVFERVELGAANPTARDPGIDSGTTALSALAGPRSTSLAVTTAPNEPSIDSGRGTRTPVRPLVPREIEAPLDPSIVGLPGGSLSPSEPPGWIAAGTCAASLCDQTGGACLLANSSPTLGQLYPISSNLFVDAATGFVGIATTTPTKQLDVAGSVGVRNGDVDLYNQAGEPTVEFDSGGAGAGRIRVSDAVGATRVLLSASFGGDAALFNTSGLETLSLDGFGAGGGGLVSVRNSSGQQTVEVRGDNADGGRIIVQDDSLQPTVELIGQATGDGGEMTVKASDGNISVLVDGEDVNDAGFIAVSNDVSRNTIQLFGDNGADAGRIDLYNRNGGVTLNSIRMNARDSGGTGSEIQLSTASGSNVTTIDLDGQNGIAGQLQINETDGSAAFRFLGNDLDLCTGSGVSTINFDRISGTKSAVVDTPSYGQRLLYCMESPEVWFEDLGAGRLQDGTAVVQLDPLFLETVTIDEANPMKVFVTPRGSSAGLWVEARTVDFVVHENAGGASNVAFDWRVLAKRKGLEARRLDPYVDPLEKLGPAADPVQPSASVAPNDLVGR